MFWELYIHKKKLTKDGERYWLRQVDAMFACHIAAWEGMMYESSQRGDKEKYHAYQKRIRNLLLQEYSQKELPKELDPGYFPAPRGWSGDEV